MEFYALVSTELQKVDLGLWNDSDSYKHQQVMADAIKSPSIPASDEQTQLIYIHQTSGASSVTLDGNNSDNTVLNNNQINMLIEQQHDAGTQTHIIEQQQTPRQGSASSGNENVRYVNAPNGLFPMPLSKTAKTSQISRLKFKFKFLGKFMAKAVMDSRMVRVVNFCKKSIILIFYLIQLDLPLSIPFYRWLLNEENSISLADLGQIAPEVQGTLLRLNEIVKKREIIQADVTLDAMEKTEKVKRVNFNNF